MALTLDFPEFGKCQRHFMLLFMLHKRNLFRREKNWFVWLSRNWRNEYAVIRDITSQSYNRVKSSDFVTSLLLVSPSKSRSFPPSVPRVWPHLCWDNTLYVWKSRAFWVFQINGHTSIQNASLIDVSLFFIRQQTELTQSNTLGQQINLG